MGRFLQLALLVAATVLVVLPSVGSAQPVPTLAPGPAPEAREAPRPRGSLVLAPAPGGELVVRSRPGGGVVARLGERTEFGSPTTLAVVRERGLRSSRTRMRLVLDLSARRLVLEREGRSLRRMTVAVGRPGSSTPIGRFAVTDKLSGPAYSPYYGCCILALSAHQPNLPPGWTGGDRIAIHGTNDPSSIGQASSAGCPRASDADLRYLMRVVPLGAPVTVRA